MSKPDYYVENVPYVTADKLDAANDRIAAALAVLDHAGMELDEDGFLYLDLLDRIRAALTPPPVRHTFGGVVFEQGRTRTPDHDEYWLDEAQDPGRPKVKYGGTHGQQRPILRPVALESGA